MLEREATIWNHMNHLFVDFFQVSLIKGKKRKKKSRNIWIKDTENDGKKEGLWLLFDGK